MLFFAIVYVVEGIGQARVGIILQPLSYFLKTSGWTPLQVTAYFAVLNFPPNEAPAGWRPGYYRLDSDLTRLNESLLALSR